MKKAVLSFSGAPYESVVVRVFKAGLQSVVVNVCDRKLGLYSLDSHSLEFKVCHGACGVLSESLIDPQTDLAANGHVAAEQVAFYKLLCNSAAHLYPSV